MYEESTTPDLVELTRRAHDEWEERMVVRVTRDTDVDAARAAAERLAQERADG
jgi:hypothetical protein